MLTPAAQRWSSILEEVADSGLSVREFARKHGLNASTLSWWRWKLTQDADETEEDDRFVEAVALAPAPSLCVRLGRVTIDVDDDTDLFLLRRVVGALS